MQIYSAVDTVFNLLFNLKLFNILLNLILYLMFILYLFNLRCKYSRNIKTVELKLNGTGIGFFWRTITLQRTWLLEGRQKRDIIAQFFYNSLLEYFICRGRKKLWSFLPCLKQRSKYWKLLLLRNVMFLNRFTNHVIRFML